jgi:hypothetical protein
MPRIVAKMPVFIAFFLPGAIHRPQAHLSLYTPHGPASLMAGKA